MRLSLTALVVALPILGNGCPADTYTTHRDIPYTSVNGVATNLLSLDVYAPNPSPPQPAPVLIWIHGGGWAIGDKSYQMRYKPTLFTQAGYCFVSINYRLSPRPASNDPARIKFPVHEQDVASAIAWVHDHIKDYGGDPTRIALAGHSAGAQLAALVSTDPKYLQAHGLGLDAIRGTIVDDTEGYDVPHVISSGLSSIYVNAFGDDPQQQHDASALFHVAAGQHIPPMLIVERGMPDRVTQAEAFVSALRAAQIPVTVLDAHGYTHNQVNAEIGVPNEKVVTPPMLAFLAQHLATGK